MAEFSLEELTGQPAPVEKAPEVWDPPAPAGVRTLTVSRSEPRSFSLEELNGNTPASPEVQSARTERESMNPVMRGADTLVRGLGRAFPFMDDIAAAGDASIQAIPGIGDENQRKQSWTERYNANLAKQRAINTVEDTDSPVTSYGGQVAGTLALPVGPVGAVAKGVGNVAARTPILKSLPSVGNLLGKSAGVGTVGAGYGAMYGFGQGTSMEERLDKAKSGAIVGGVGGAAIPVAGAAIKGSWSAAGRPFAGWINPAKEAERRIAAAQAKGVENISPAAAKEAAANGQPVMVGDIGGGPVASLMQSMKNASPEAKEVIGSSLAQRFQSQQGRFKTFIQNLTGNKLDLNKIDETLQNLQANVNSTAYKAAYAKGANGVWDKDLVGFINHPAIQDVMPKAISLAKTAAANKGQPMVREPFVQDASGKWILNPNAVGPNTTAYPTLEFWDQIQRALRDEMKAAYRSGHSSLGTELRDTHRQLLAKLDNAVPEFGTARAGASKFFGAENAFEAGQKYVAMTGNLKIGQMEKVISQFSPQERRLFELGFGGDIMQKILHAPTSKEISAHASSPEVQQKIMTVFGPQNGEKFIGYMQTEAAMTQLRRAIMGNSTTFEQFMNQNLATHGGHSPLEIAKNLATNPVGAAISAGAATVYHDPEDKDKALKNAGMAFVAASLFRLNKGAQDRVIMQMAEKLTSNDPKKITEALDTVMGKQFAKQIGTLQVQLAKELSAEPKLESRQEQPSSLSAPTVAPMPAPAVPGRPVAPAAVARATGGAVNHEPTDAQKEAGNYKKKHITFAGMDIALENLKGGYRRGVDNDGKKWQVKMPADYGYIKRTEGADGDHVDVYVGPNTHSEKVFVIDQVDHSDKSFDEHKIMLGFKNKSMAMNAYTRAFSDGKAYKRIGHMSECTLDEFKQWLKDGNQKEPMHQGVKRASGGRILFDELMAGIERSKSALKEHTSSYLSEGH